jgi:CHASE3 domain sensor protein
MSEVQRASRKGLRLWVRIATAGLMLCLLALVFDTYRFAQYAERGRQEALRQVELNGRIRQMQTILVNLESAESAQRGYMLSGDRADLAPYLAATAELPRLLDGLSGIPVAPEKKSRA